MPGFNPDKTNIHEITLDEPEKERQAFFDPERDIDLKDRQALFKRAENDHEIASFLKAIFTSSEIKENAYQSAQHALGGAKDLKYWRLFAEAAFAVKILGSQQDLEAEYDNETRQNVIQELNKCKKERDWWHFLEIGANMKIVDPSLDVDLNKNWEEIREEFQNHVKRSVNWTIILSMASAIKILGQKLELDEDFWRQAKAIMESAKERNDWRGFANDAFNLAVLSADQVRIPEGGGLELIRHKSDLGREVPQIPEKRNF